MFEIDKIRNQLEIKIKKELEKLGLLFGVFSRVKDDNSIKVKLTRKDYAEHGKKIQDMIGIRITLYFSDDESIVVKLLRNKFKLDNKDIDKFEEDTFRPKRLNLVFEMPEFERDVFNEVIQSTGQYPEDIIDPVFEVQIRTVLSEGWHEVEHDLRYKCKEDWEDHKDLSRALNGIYATLETSEWSMNNLFNELAYRNYKEKNWEAMLRNKFRLRFKKNKINDTIIRYLNDDIDNKSKENFGKAIYKVNRTKFLEILSVSRLALPLTFDNLIYVINYIYIKDVNINNLAPEFIRNEIQDYL